MFSHAMSWAPMRGWDVPTVGQTEWRPWVCHGHCPFQDNEARFTGGQMVMGGWAITIELYWKRLSKFQACLHLWGFDTFCFFSFLSCQPPAYSHSTVGLLWELLGSPQPAFPPGALETVWTCPAQPPRLLPVVWFHAARLWASWGLASEFQQQEQHQGDISHSTNICRMN